MSKPIGDKIEELEKKYFDLVWYARANPKDLAAPADIRAGRAAAMKRIKAAYPREVAALSARGSTWDHGFNSGILAAVRLLRAYALPLDYQRVWGDGEEDDDEPPFVMTRGSEIDQAERDFPFLDT
jgi:hypothetical protein